MTTATVEQELFELEKAYWRAISDKDVEAASSAAIAWQRSPKYLPSHVEECRIRSFEHSRN